MQTKPTNFGTEDVKKYGRPVYRIDDPKKFQNETPLIVNEYQKRSVVRITPINSSAMTYFRAGTSIEFVIKNHEYVNFKNSVIYCDLITAATPGTYITRPYNTCSYIKRLQVFLGGGDPIENINEYGLKESVISSLLAKKSDNDMLTMKTCIPVAARPFSRYVECTAGPPHINDDVVTPTAAANEQCPIIIPLNFCLTDSDYINLYNISDDGIRIILELNSAVNVLRTDGTVPTFWLGNPRIELDVITTSTQNRLSTIPYTIRAKTYTEGSFLWPIGSSSVSANIQTHNVSVNSIIFINRLTTAITAGATNKMKDTIHTALTDPNLVHSILNVDNCMYPFQRTVDSIQVKWMALQQYLKQYEMGKTFDSLVSSDMYRSGIFVDVDNDEMTKIAGIANTLGVHAYSFDTWPQEGEIIDGIGGRSSTININFYQSAGTPIGANDTITYFIGSDLLITIENGNVKTMNR